MQVVSIFQVKIIYHIIMYHVIFTNHLVMVHLWDTKLLNSLTLFYFYSTYCKFYLNLQMHTHTTSLTERFISNVKPNFPLYTHCAINSSMCKTVIFIELPLIQSNVLFDEARNPPYFCTFFHLFTYCYLIFYFKKTKYHIVVYIYIYIIP